MSVTRAMNSSSMRSWLIGAVMWYLLHGPVGLAVLFLVRVDPVEDALVVEEPRLRLVPARHERRDREQLDLGEALGVLLQHLGVGRPVVIPGDDLLRLGRVEEFQVF